MAWSIRFTLVQLGGAALVLALIGGATFASLVVTAEDGHFDGLDPRCEGLDRAVTKMLADLMTQRDDAVDRDLGDSMVRLRHARRNCRFGWIDWARLDYEALLAGRYGAR